MAYNIFLDSSHDRPLEIRSLLSLAAFISRNRIVNTRVAITTLDTNDRQPFFVKVPVNRNATVDCFMGDIEVDITLNMEEVNTSTSPPLWLHDN